jgi:hypothetical protein
MATIKELQEKIAKLEKGINSKATNPTAKAKARLLVKKFKSDIADLKAKSKPTTSKVSKAKEISKEMKRKYSKSRPFGKSDIYQDAVRPAKRIGKRTSAEGNTYYEYRENRTDRKQPPKRYPRLEDGGMMSDGGKIKVGDFVNINGRKTKILDTYTDKSFGTKTIYLVNVPMYEGVKNSPMTKGRYIIDDETNQLRKIERKDYVMADGGMMARGGESDGLDKVRDKVNDFLNPLGYSARVEESVGDVLYIIEPSTRKVGKNRSDFFDGMQITAFRDGTFEVSEYMAGKNEDELHIYKETKSLILALKDLVKGNKRKPIKKYEDGGAIDLLSDTSSVGLQNVGGTSFSNVDLTPQMDITNPMFANGGELHRSQDGMYAKGGQTSKYKYKVILVIKNSNSDSYEGVLPIDVALFMSKGDALMCVRSLQEKAPSNYQYRLQDNIK